MSNHVIPTDKASLLGLAYPAVEYQLNYNLSSFHLIFMFSTRQEFNRFSTISTNIEHHGIK